MPEQSSVRTIKSGIYAQSLVHERRWLKGINSRSLLHLLNEKSKETDVRPDIEYTTPVVEVDTMLQIDATLEYSLVHHVRFMAVWTCHRHAIRQQVSPPTLNDRGAYLFSSDVGHGLLLSTLTLP
jgi:hypothetical protein